MSGRCLTLRATSCLQPDEGRMVIAGWAMGGTLRLRLRGGCGSAAPAPGRPTWEARPVSQEHLAIIERFYGAFARRDGAAMAACYAPEATFSDPAFGRLDAADAGAMWRMLTERAEDLRI